MGNPSLGTMAGGAPPEPPAIGPLTWQPTASP
jgi:hypothetical protein